MECREMCGGSLLLAFAGLPAMIIGFIGWALLRLPAAMIAGASGLVAILLALGIDELRNKLTEKD